MAGCGVMVVFAAELEGICAAGDRGDKESGGVVNDCGIVEGGAAGGMPRAPTIAQCQSFDHSKLPPSGPRKTVICCQERCFL